MTPRPRTALAATLAIALAFAATLSSGLMATAANAAPLTLGLKIGVDEEGLRYFADNRGHRLTYDAESDQFCVPASDRLSSPGCVPPTKELPLWGSEFYNPASGTYSSDPIPPFITIQALADSRFCIASRTVDPDGSFLDAVLQRCDLRQPRQQFTLNEGSLTDTPPQALSIGPASEFSFTTGPAGAAGGWVVSSPRRPRPPSPDDGRPREDWMASYGVDLYGGRYYQLRAKGVEAGCVGVEKGDLKTGNAIVLGPCDAPGWVLRRVSHNPLLVPGSSFPGLDGGTRTSAVPPRSDLAIGCTPLPALALSRVTDVVKNPHPNVRKPRSIAAANGSTALSTVQCKAGL